MPFARPTLQELIDRAVNDIEARLPGVDARLRRSFLNVIARMHSGAVHGLYGNLNWIAKQVIPDTAEAEILERWAGIWGVTRKAGTKAKGNLTFTGTNGSVIPVGTVLQRSDSAEYTTDAEATIAAGTATVAVTASVAGSAGNTDAGSALTLVSPIAGVNNAATVAAGGLAGGADSEDDEDLRDRLLERIQEPPQGGAEADYTLWAKSVAGVTRVWVYPSHMGPGTVGVTFVMDDQAGTIIPPQQKVDEVEAYITDPVRKPVTAEVIVFAPTAHVVNFSIQLTPNTAAVQAAVQAELEDLLRRESEPGGTILLSHIREAISVAAGETNHVLVAPAADVVAPAGSIHELGVITWL